MAQQKQKNIVINCYTDCEDAKSEGVKAEAEAWTKLKELLEAQGYCVDPNTVDLDKTYHQNLIDKIENAKHTISVVTKKSIENFFKDEDHYQCWLRALHKTLDEDNVLTHIIFCVDVDVEKVTWYLRQFNPCIRYSSGNDKWKAKLLDVLKSEKKSVKTLKHVNAGEALAWSHYTGYVSFLPNVDAGGPKDESVWSSKDGKPVINELVMLLPTDCHCPDQIDNPSITGPFESQRYTFHRAGKERKLNADLYKIEGVEKLVPIACAPSIETLRLLKEDKGLDEKWLQDQRKRYVAVLKERMESDEYLRRKVILIDDYDSSKPNFAEVVRGRIEKAWQEKQKGTSDVEKTDRKKGLSVYIRFNKDDSELAGEIESRIREKMPNVEIVGGRVIGTTEHEEKYAKIEEAAQCIFLLTEKSEVVSAENEACACVEKVIECNNKRGTILLYKKEAKNKANENIFKLLAEHFVAHIEYGGDKWEKTLVDTITERQACPLQSAVNLHNIAEGLAFGYLYGYLKIFLPEWPEKMAQSEKVKEVSDVMPKKIIIVMPKSGFSPHSLAKKDNASFKEVEYNERRIDKIKKRIACQDRNFSVTEYSLKDEDGKEYFVAAEFLTPLAQLTEMQGNIFADMSIKQKREEQKKLRKVMLEIKKSEMIPEDLVDKFILLEIEDEHVDEKGQVIKLLTDAEKLDLYRQELLKTVKEELKRERENPADQVPQQVETAEIK